MLKWLWMFKKRMLRHTLQRIQRSPLEIAIPIAALFFIIIFYSIAFLIEKPVTFSYAGATCVKQLTLLPGLHQLSGESKYAAHTSNELTIGGVTWAAFSMCFTPKEAPQEGKTKISTAPFGGWLARKTFVVEVPPPVKANIGKIIKPIPATKPLTIELSSADRIFSYTLIIDGRQAACKPQGEGIACSIDSLDLIQGKTYSSELVRKFHDKKVATVAKKNLSILSATNVTSSSIRVGETVYARPKTLLIEFDKRVARVAAELYRVEADKRTKIPTSVKLTDKHAEVILANELPRQADYELVVDGVQASDGSSLEDPYKLPFKTSGGPKVTNVNIGRIGVALGTTMIITFDQPLSETQDIGKAVSAVGGGVITGKRNNQISISLAGVPKCGDFSVKITDALQSNYEIAGGSAWSFAGRMVCHTISTIGYSSKGRAINAYHFGGGSRAVLYTGAIHGNEYSTASLMERWIQDLEANARKIPVDTGVVVVPRINPDGTAAGSRVNAHNIDLNRNFATSDWRTDITDVNNRPFPGGGGPSPMSEPETAAIAALASRLRPMLILSYHSIGGLLAANQAGNSNAFANTYSQLSGYRNTTGQTSTTFEYGISGTADDWYGERLGVASILIELGSHTYNQFERNQRAMWAMLDG